MADLESQIRSLADRRFARTSPVEFTGESRLPLEDRSHDGATPIDGTEMIVSTNETTRPRRNWYVLGAAAALIAIVVVGIAFVAGDDDPAPQTDSSVEDPAPQDDAFAEVVESATAFWEALAAGDRDAALGVVSPEFVDAGTVSPFGRARTLAGQFDWYEAVGWRWTLEDCDMADADTALCTATASNAWSDALGVEPVTGAFVVRLAEGGIVAVDDSASFTTQWGPTVFGPFEDWVRANHPEDAAVMFNFANDVNSEILSLYEVNTQRFVEAHQGE